MYLFLLLDVDRFFGFGGATRKKPSATSSTVQGQGLMTQVNFTLFLINSINLFKLIKLDAWSIE